MRFANFRLPPSGSQISVSPKMTEYTEPPNYRCSTRQSGGETTGFPVPENYSDCSRVAQHALVLGLGGHVQSNSSEPAKSAQSLDTAVQSDPSQKSDKLESPCMAPRATAIKEQGFSEAVAARIEAPQRKSTRSVYEAKWAIFTKYKVQQIHQQTSTSLRSRDCSPAPLMDTDLPLLINWVASQSISAEMIISPVS